MGKLSENTYFFVDRFSSLDDLRGKDRSNPIAILAALQRAGRFSCFEVDPTLAGPLTAILSGPYVIARNEEIVKDPDGYGSTTRSLYPWTYIEITPAGRAALEQKGQRS